MLMSGGVPVMKSTDLVNWKLGSYDYFDYFHIEDSVSADESRIDPYNY